MWPLVSAASEQRLMAARGFTLMGDAFKSSTYHQPISSSIASMARVRRVIAHDADSVGHPLAGVLVQSVVQAVAM